MKFDPATASLGPAMEPSDFSDMMQGGLAYRNAASGTTIYAAQLPGGPEVQEPNGEAFSIDATAKLTPLPGNPFLAGSSAQSIAMHPSGNFVYFSQQDLNQSGIAGYSIGATGIPQLLPGSPFSRSQVGDAGMAVEPRGRFLFALPLGTEIYTFPIRTDGTLEAPRVTVSSDTESVSGCTCLQVSPDGKYLYAASDSVITAFSIDPQSGALTPVPGASVPAGNQITSFAMSSDGSFLFASDCCDSTILVFATNRSTTGILTPASSLPGPPTGSGPFPIATHGPFVFVGSSITQNDFTGSTVTGTISVYALDSTSGMLTFKGSFPTPGGPETIIAVP